MKKLRDAIREFRYRVNDWLDEKVNPPLPKKPAAVGWDLAASADVILSLGKAMQYPTGTSFRMLKNRHTPKRRPFDWKLDSKEVA